MCQNINYIIQSTEKLHTSKYSEQKCYAVTNNLRQKQLTKWLRSAIIVDSKTPVK